MSNNSIKEGQLRKAIAGLITYEKNDNDGSWFPSGSTFLIIAIEGEQAYYARYRFIDENGIVRYTYGSKRFYEKSVEV